MRHRLAVLIVLMLTVGALSVAPASGAHRGPVLDEPRNGSQAVQALGDHLPEVARAHDTTAAELRERLEHDKSLWVDTGGRLFYIDPTAPDHVEGDDTTVVDPALSTTDPFALHSRGGAQRTIYLDFTGHGGTYGGEIGGAWDAKYTGGDGSVAPYSEDSDPAFSAAEQATIRSVWQRVAEDFAPFDVNVTTQQPAEFETINRAGGTDEVYGTRVVITPSSETTCGCGGVAYVGVFDYYGSYGHAYYQPAFVYTTGAKNVAEAASHEAGHNLGLSHDGTRSSGYYAGHGDWAPIMGVGYYEPITQWSRGEYSGANNTEDDFTVAGSNGAPLRLDETDSNSYPVSSTTTTPVTASGTIERATDADQFAFSAVDAATVTITAAPAPTSPNLDIKLTLRDALGTVIAENDPLSSLDKTRDEAATGLDATLTAQVAAGASYTVSVDGVGAHDPAIDGYSGYGSLGDYTVSITGSAPDGSGGDTGGGDGTGGEVTTAPAAPTYVEALVSGSSVIVSWDNTDNETGFEVRREKKHKGSWVASDPVAVSADTTSYTDQSPGSGTFRYWVRAVNDIGASTWAGPSNEVAISGPKGGGNNGNKK